MDHCLKRSVLLFLAAFMVVLLVSPAAATEVTRELPSSVSPATEFEVTLTIDGIEAGGIIEEIPETFAFVGTTHPGPRTEVSGQKVIFSVVEETTITYTVMAPSSGRGTFTGLWDDAVYQTDGKIPDGTVTVSSSSDGGEWGDASTTTVVPTENKTDATKSVSERTFTFEGKVIRSIALTSESSLSESTLTVTPASLPDGVPAVRAVAYGYYAADLAGLEKNGSVAGATVVFAVDTAWIEEHKISEASIALAAYDPAGGWTLLPTTLDESAEGQVTFKAEAKGLPLFAIIGTERPADTAPAKTPVTIAAPGAAAEKETLPPAGEEDGGGTLPLIGLLGVLAVVAVFGLYVMTKKKGGDKE